MGNCPFQNQHNLVAIDQTQHKCPTTRVGYCQILQKYQILVGGVMQIKNGWVGYLLPKSEKGHLVQTAFEGFCKNIFGWKRTKTKCNAVLARRVFANSLSASNQIRTLGNTQACCQIWCIPLASTNRAADLGKFSSGCKKRKKMNLEGFQLLEKVFYYYAPALREDL